MDTIAWIGLYEYDWMNRIGRIRIGWILLHGYDCMDMIAWMALDG
jgi:hypothetical protein